MPPTAVAADPFAGQIPFLNKKTLTATAGVVVLIWVTAILTGSKIVIAVVAVLTIALGVLLGYAWRQIAKQKKVFALLQGAQGSPEARAAALAELAAQDPHSKDVLNGIAKAQLQAQDNPDLALVTLQGLDLSKVPQDAADQVRTFRAQLLLVKNRTREARDLADQINVPTTGPLQARAMMAAVVAEAWARTGRHTQALVLLEDYKLDNSELGQTQPMLLFARVFTHFALGHKDRVLKFLRMLMAQDMNLLGRFVQPGPGIHMELRKLATEVLQTHPTLNKAAKAQHRMTQPRSR